jgi:hypothetical protein
VRVRIAPLVMGKEPPQTEAPADQRVAAETKSKAAVGRADRSSGPSTEKRQGAAARQSEKRRFFGWMVRRSAETDAAAPAPDGPPAKIDESVFFSETGRLP